MLNESERLATLNRYRVLDTPAEPAFDHLTRLASLVTGKPISLLSFVDASRQWFKSSVGLGVQQTPREWAFCLHAIESDGPMIVHDALEDPRFVDNPLVRGEPHIRFYAGVPLVMENGAALGTLCVIDNQPGELDSMQMEALSLLRDEAVCHLELRRRVLNREPLDDLMMVCAWCSKVRRLSADGQSSQWVDFPDYIREHRKISHGICPSCKEEAIREMGDLKN